jgi:hypothetical protein
MRRPVDKQVAVFRNNRITVETVAKEMSIQDIRLTAATTDSLCFVMRTEKLLEMHIRKRAGLDTLALVSVEALHPGMEQRPMNSRTVSRSAWLTIGLLSLSCLASPTDVQYDRPAFTVSVGHESPRVCWRARYVSAASGI